MQYPSVSILRPAWAGLPILLLIAGACADTPSAPPSVAIPAPRPSADLAAADTRPALIPSTTKYSNTSKPNATGRDGGSALYARALLDKTGVTTLDVSTADIGAPTPPGTIDKVQVKLLDATTGEAVWTDNYTALRKLGMAQFQYTYITVSAGQPLQLQANISGMDTRTGVVTITEVVKRRPDPTVVGLTAPAKAFQNTPVTITAAVREGNEDVGAMADCELWVDGALADQAREIWIDAGSEVSCAFAHSFATLGTHQVEVRLTDVAPADWDANNNSATASLEIVSPVTHSHWASITDQTDNYYRQEYVNRYPLSGGSPPGYYYYSHQREGQQRSASFSSAVSDGLTWPSTYTVTLTSGGQTLAGGTLAFSAPRPSSDAGAIARECTVSPVVSTAAGQINGEVCITTWYSGPASDPARTVVRRATSAYARTSAERVVYVSSWYEQWYYQTRNCSWFSCYYTWNPISSGGSSTGTNGVVTLAPAAADLAVTLTLADATRSFRGFGTGGWSPFQTSGSRTMPDYTCSQGSLTSTYYKCERSTSAQTYHVNSFFGSGAEGTVATLSSTY